MRKAIAASAAALLCASAAPGYNTHFSSATPPQAFRGFGETTVRIVPEAEIETYCPPRKDMPEGVRIIACTKFGMLGNVIIFPDPCPYSDSDYTARILCHEIAHSLGGWPSNHPDTKP